MLFSTTALFLCLALAKSADAQSTIHDIVVGSAAGALTYTPSFISASVGDQVVFHFHQKNHTATQSSFSDPCHKISGGFDSGFMPVSATDTDDFPTFSVTVNDTKPIWVYCRQADNTPESHCGNGMVFAVNPGANGTSTSFQDYLNNALAEGAQFKASASATASSSAASGSWTTAAYGGVTIPAAPTESVVTETITVQASSWTTTYSSYPGSPAATPVSLDGTVHTVIVGGSDGQLTYTPSNITAAPRDVVVFQFHQKNHTATQSAFADPCRILTDETTGEVIGLDSGFMPVGANATEFPTFNVTVNDTAPLWFYCKQHLPTGASHCGMGMVFAVNAVADSPRNFSAFQELAIELNGTNAVSASGSSSAPGSTTTKSPGGASASFSMNFVLVFGSAAAFIGALL
ncbi:hypothetical protein POSPLADRAFT_1068589 [Postia placenta MAD-698-R-SB12]|uniref:Phytocyanin domain-containing protein n=1 Tax=Postia placenta MAD-698-R-SB12 TaxID=670580 RepID=A0A1X6NGC0_9APHY|nr:hypothetical protein POSPLADRAFT_1068589 [Postia placenta MAD-698-R-SB12]OSX67691.1 hypothetical protein POSPLADRAFT_1068589 [Postia placenta MAD-698-R-SB12]